jgi:hypothetical protein
MKKKPMTTLLDTLLSLLDEIHELKKRIYVLERQGRQSENSDLFLQSAIESAAFEVEMLRSNVQYAEEQLLEYQDK